MFYSGGDYEYIIIGGGGVILHAAGVCVCVYMCIVCVFRRDSIEHGKVYIWHHLWS